MTLEERINALANSESPERSDDTLALLQEFRTALNRGEVRVAEPEASQWKTNLWVKKGVMLHLALGLLRDVTVGGSGSHFDLDTLPARRFELGERVRVPAGGSVVRDGVYLGPGVACIPPVYIDLGVYAGSATVIDAHVLIGICTQIGQRVQIGSGTQIGGFLGPPAERLPTIISDDVVIGGNCGLYGGVWIGPGAIVTAGTVLTAQSRVYDPSRQAYYRAGNGQPLAIPPMAIIVPGARPITKGSAARSGLLIQVPIVAGYRNDPAAEEYLDNLLD